MVLDTPVAFIIFNRPDLTKLVFSKIREAKPKKLLVIADGPRFLEEKELCKKTRSVIEQVDWNCEVLTNYSDTNKTSPIRCLSGLNWVFSLVEEAIILEDDCLPTLSFFYFCQNLINKYRHDERIMSISGSNFQFGKSRTSYSYYFSKYAHIWGWATWKRSWSNIDFEMKKWENFKKEQLLKFVCEDPYELKFWTKIFDKCVYENDLHWDCSWLFTCWSRSGLTILPNKNLVSNIGFREDATHTTSADNPRANLPTIDIWNIKHPPFVVQHKEADEFTFDTSFGGYYMKLSKKPS
ncbi:hypothetical protein Xen7305DRAFT_00054000 [Xenococcus sp. PCC 7305]|uniref:hypothetical protein n=1 Tax=Xenococcus sp. PCC 7305 TaxID=102125 RepID=UPI0002AD06D7|nr:hypothetical protein [Xenococcus sp. PCC 7305]ELS05650.1 hypothetical protein Xen7305DRAFT_00054000 [Xenococcus sp. PCC 7305]